MYKTLIILLIILIILLSLKKSSFTPCIVYNIYRQTTDGYLVLAVSVKSMSVYNGLADAVASGPSASQASMVEQATQTEIGEQGSALAKAEGLDEDTGADVSKRGVDPDRKGETDRPSWERVAE